jgi:tetratricopeptide (TPR) repeat protein
VHGAGIHGEKGLRERDRRIEADRTTESNGRFRAPRVALRPCPGQYAGGRPEELQAAVYLAPDSAVAHHYLGTALFETQSFDQAEKEFREAVRLEPTAQNHYSLAACLMATGHNDEALAELENASRLDPAQNLYRARKEELMRVMAQPSHQ